MGESEVCHCGVKRMLGAVSFLFGIWKWVEVGVLRLIGLDRWCDTLGVVRYELELERKCIIKLEF